MIRRLNYTGRKRIARSRVTVRLLPAPGGGWRFDAEFDLAEAGFPPDASVYIEAYNATSYQRFPFGTVGARLAPPDRGLREITPSPLPKFRLKVVDAREGLLLGVADKLVPLQPDESLAHKQSLLPVEFRDLGERIWRLDVSDWPVLELNERVADLGEIARSGEFVPRAGVPGGGATHPARGGGRRGADRPGLRRVRLDQPVAALRVRPARGRGAAGARAGRRSRGSARRGRGLDRTGGAGVLPRARFERAMGGHER